MILRRIARPQAIAKTAQQASSSHTTCSPSFSIQQQTRNLHSVPHLGPNNSRAVYFAENGVPGFLSPRTFSQTWTKYQADLCDQINEKTADNEYATKTAYQMHLEFSRQPQHADFYNVTAMAHFNHFWWESLAPEKTEPHDTLRKDIEERFGSLKDLRNEMLEHGDAMFGNGFVWLIKEHGVLGMHHTPLKILCTYNAGSPYSEAWRMRQAPKEQLKWQDPETIRRARMQEVQNTAGSSGQYSQQARMGYASPVQLNGTPLLCLNVWQHMWIPDYGILGKRSYLAAWWERIDWDRVFDRYNNASRRGGGSFAS